jgi:hypothetical protein
MTIPRILHQIWLGRKPLPDAFARYRETWRHHHPAWTSKLWTEENMPSDLYHGAVYETLRFPAERADLLRLELLWRQGGVYVDVDFECLLPVDPLLDDVRVFAADLKPGSSSNALIGAEPRDPLLGRAVEEARPVTRYGYSKDAAGPRFVDRIFRSDPRVTFFPPPLFYPVGPEQRRSAFAVHHSARSWKDAVGFDDARQRAERRLESAQARLDLVRERSASLEGKIERAQAELARMRRSVP